MTGLIRYDRCATITQPYRFALALLIVTASMLFASCGGGGGSTTTTSAPADTGESRIVLFDGEDSLAVYGPDGEEYDAIDVRGLVNVSAAPGGEALVVSTLDRAAVHTSDGTENFALDDPGSYPQLNPDADMVVFDATPGDVKYAQVMVQEVGEEEAERLTTEDERNFETASFTGDGERIVYLDRCYDCAGGEGLATISPDGENREVHGELPEDPNAHPLMASPDGDRIAYVAYSADPIVNQVWVAEIENPDDAEQLTEYTEDDEERELQYVTWSPDGSTLVALADDGLHLIDPESGDMEQIAEFELGTGWGANGLAWITSEDFLEDVEHP